VALKAKDETEENSCTHTRTRTCTHKGPIECL